MSENLAIVILSAGKGSRMRSHLPKVMHNIANFPMIWHILQTSKALNPKMIINITAPDMADVRDYCEKITAILNAIQEQQNGTGGALLAAKNILSSHRGNILVLYGDTPLITPQTLEFALSRHMDGEISVLGIRPDNPTGYGRLLTENDELKAIIECKDADYEQKQITLCNSGIMILPSPICFELLGKIENNNAQGEYYLTDIIEQANKNNIKCRSLLVNHQEMMGINDKLQLSAADEIMQKRIREKLMLMGVQMQKPESSYFSSDCEIAAGVELEPNIYIGTGVKIHSGVVIKANSYIEGAEIEEGAVIGPFARIRATSKIGQSAKIGNFVEVKNVEIGQGAKVNHLSYIGDSRIGQGSNIGAGTITCNYDGYNKYQTIIGENVFIGSNSCLIAPTEIGDNTIIAAASVIKGNIENNSLAISRPDLLIKKDGAKKFREKRRK